MELLSWLIFLGAVFVGSYIQSVAGFAMGMIVVAVCGASGTIALPQLAATVSLISFVNVIVAIKGHLTVVDRPLFAWMAAGQIPAIGIGIFVMTVLDREAQTVLQLLLGIFITCGSLSMMLRPTQLAQRSPRWACLTAGISGGLFGGMFSASGPIIGWFAYRQPLELKVIRATMLAFFAVATFTRSAIVGTQGGITDHVLQLVLVALLPVVLGSWLGRRLPPPVSDTTVKRMVFALLLIMGTYIIYSALS